MQQAQRTKKVLNEWGDFNDHQLYKLVVIITTGFFKFVQVDLKPHLIVT